MESGIAFNEPGVLLEKLQRLIFTHSSRDQMRRGIFLPRCSFPLLDTLPWLVILSLVLLRRLLLSSLKFS